MTTCLCFVLHVGRTSERTVYNCKLCHEMDGKVGSVQDYCRSRLAIVKQGEGDYWINISGDAHVNPNHPIEVAFRKINEEEDEEDKE